MSGGCFPKVYRGSSDPETSIATSPALPKVIVVHICTTVPVSLTQLQAPDAGSSDQPLCEAQRPLWILRWTIFQLLQGWSKLQMDCCRCHGL